MAGDSHDDESESRNTCKYCNKPAVNKIAKCIKCESVMHRYCCEKRNMEVSVNNTVNCCMSSEEPKDVPIVQGNIAPMQVCTEDHSSTTDGIVDQLRLEIAYLTKLLAERQQIIQDKSTIIADKEYIIRLQEQQLKLYAAQVRNLETFPPIPANGGPRKPNNRSAGGGDKNGHVLSQADSDSDRYRQSPVAGATSGCLGEGGVADGGGGLGGVMKPTSGLATDITERVQDGHQRDRGSGGRTRASVERAKIAGRTEIITGTAEIHNQGADLSFAGAARRAWLYVGRVNAQVKEEDVKKYLEQRFVGKSFKVEMLPRRDSANSISFKVAADMDMLDDLNKPETWPRGVLVKRFRFFREKAIRQQPL